MTPRNPAPEAERVPAPRRKLAMTKADWDRVEQAVRRGEHSPDPAQITVLIEDRALKQSPSQRRNRA